jgi:hypothetical protein
MAAGNQAEETMEISLSIAGRSLITGGSSPEAIQVVSQPDEFVFSLHQKQVDFAGVEFTQYWMDQRQVYGDRKRSESLHRVLVDCYWAICRREGTVLDDGVQESYILANLLPSARSNGSRRVLLDSTPTRSEKSKQNRTELVDELNVLLRSSHDQIMNLVDFRNVTGNAIGPPLYPDDTISLYREFEKELLEKGRARLEKEGPAGLKAAEDQWQDWMTRIGRRAGREEDKEILDMFSYECRAALHRCYAAVWEEILKNLHQDDNLPFQSALFHKFWHQDQAFPSDHPGESYFHLFHGHIFALHPAGGYFLMAPTGRQLMGEWLSASGQGQSFGRLLNGLATAVHLYASRHNVYAELRKKQPEQAPGGNLEMLQEELLDTKSGRRMEKRI